MLFGVNFSVQVIKSNSPDPGVLFYKGVYYAATTSGDEPNHFPIHTSVDLVTWHTSGYIFPQDSKTGPKFALCHRYLIPNLLFRWAKQDYWAPEIHVVNNKFVAYFAARDDTGVLCVGAAFSMSDSPLGPYK